MSDSRVVVRLYPIGRSDTIPHRTLTFDSESDRFEVGRASKREDKDLAPAHDNALFDSRVMSRTHAVLGISLEKKLVFVMDPGSMHGTWVNGKKISVEKEVALWNGDILAFGVEVVRGSDTFPPLAVRCEYQWSIAPSPSRPSVQKPATSTNTFSVPEDDDDDDHGDDCEITSQNPVQVQYDLTADQESDSNASSADSDSEDNASDAETSSPMTSPPKDDAPKDVDSVEPSVIAIPEPISKPTQPGNDELLEELEQGLPHESSYDSADPTAENMYYDEYFVHSSDEESHSEAEQEPEDIEDGDAKHEVQSAPAPSRVLAKGEVQLPPFECLVSSANGIAFESNNTLQLNSAYPVHDAGHSIMTPLERLQEHQRSGSICAPSENKATCLKSQQPRPTASKSHCSPSLPSVVSFDELGPAPYQPKTRAFDRDMSNMSVAPITSIWNDSLYTCGSYGPITRETHYPLEDAYYDGPFAVNQHDASVKASCVITPLSTAKPESMPFMDPLTPMMPRTSCNTNTKSSTEQSTRLKVLNVEPEPTASKKRKAAEMASEPALNDHPALGDTTSTDALSNTDEAIEPRFEDDSFPDAQPQTFSASFDTQFTPLSTTESSKDKQQPSKRVKTSHTGTFRRHATTAILGAVVGAVGAIAGLAAIPADYFA